MNYTLIVDASDIEVIGQGLDELKFKVAAPVAKKLQAQIVAQETAARQAANPVPQPEALANDLAAAAPEQE